MPPDKTDTKILLVAAGGVLLAGVLVAVVLLFATGQGGSPSKYAPFDAGYERQLETNVKDGGPYYIADPFGGSRNIIFSMEDGRFVALSTQLPGDRACSVRWRDSIKAYQDCDGKRHQSDELARYGLLIDETGENKGLVRIDLRELIPPPALASN